MNARSAIYLRENRKKARSIADDKLKTKRILLRHGIGVADLIAVIKHPSEVMDFEWDALPPSFVIKPNRGLGGEGIKVVFNRLKNGNWLTTRGKQLTEEDLEVHVLNILDGNYSLLHTPDVAVFEARLAVDPLYKRFSTEGIPDIRVIVYNNVPVMAMIRVPVKKSGGKANLAQGGIGIGIDIPTGMTTHAVQKSIFFEREIENHPDTSAQLRGIKLPYWDEILKTSIIAARVVGLRFAGVDISVDKKRGPVVMELNARPGLGIQVANMSPLRDRLRRIRGLKVKTPERGIAIAKDLFSGYMEDEVESITGRQVIGLVEAVELIGKDKARKIVRAKIDTGADDSSIDIALARELGFGGAIDAFAGQHLPEFATEDEANTAIDELKKTLVPKVKDISRLSVVKSSHGVSIRMHIKIPIRLAGRRMNVEPNVYDRSNLKYPVLIGRRNLSHFLIDSTKKPLKKKKPVKKPAPAKQASAAAGEGKPGQTPPAPALAEYTGAATREEE